MEELSESAPTVVVLEDLHWADEATLDVLRLLARRVETLGRARDRDVPRRRARRERIRCGSSSAACRRFRAARRLRILPLSPAAVAQLAEPHEADPDELYRLTSGNPFYVTEVLAGDVSEHPRDGPRRRSGSCRRPELVCTRGAGGRLDDAVGRRAVAPRRRSRARRIRISPSAWAPGCSPRCGRRGRFRHELARLAIEELGGLLNDARIFTRERSPLFGARSRRLTDAARLAHHADGSRGRSGRPSLRSGRSSPGVVARRSPRGCGAVPPRAPLRRRTAARRARGAARAVLERVLSDGRRRRGDRLRCSGRGRLPRAEATAAKEGETLELAGEHPVVSGTGARRRGA